MDLLANLQLGLGVALSAANLGYCLLGVVIGTFVGVLPGIGPLATISMLLPITFGLDPIGALIMLAGVYYGAQFGSSVTSILLNIPGHAASAVVCLDGYPMARQGRAAEGLVMGAIASFVGGTLSIIVLMMFAPPLAQFALRFGPPEYFAIMLLGLVSASVLAEGSFLKGLGMMLLGLAIGLVGIDVNSGAMRLTFGNWNLSDGVSFVIVAMGFFAISELVLNLEPAQKAEPLTRRFTWRELVPSVAVIRRCAGPILRGSGVGALFGVLPGSGPTMASFIAYSVEKRVARDPSRFGKGAIEGVTSPEAANNSAAVAGFIPTLTLGIPGDALMALILGALLIFGITPGPRVVTENPDLFWGLIVSMWIGNLLLVVLNIPMVGVWVRILQIPYRLLFSSILLFVCIGVYSTGNSTFDVLVLAAFGAAGYLFAKLGCPPAPLLLGLILGPLVEENLRRTLIISRGDPSVFLTRPISALFLAMTLVIVAFTVIRGLRQLRAGRRPAHR